MESLQKKEPEGNMSKNKEAIENRRKKITMQMIEQNPMGIDNLNEYLNEEEQVMKHLLQEWIHLDECFIP